MKIKTSKEIKSLIKLIENFQDESSIYNLELYIGHLLNGFPTVIFELEAVTDAEGLSEGYGIYRSRIIKDINEIKYERDLWEAPIKYNKIGRMNLELDSVLYCSNHFLTTFCELDVKKGHVFATARFEKRANSEVDKLLVIPFGENLDKYFKNNKINQDRILDVNSNLVKKEKEKYKIINEFLTTLFRKKKGEAELSFYLRTAAIAKFYRNQSHVHGFFYPSVKANYGSYNLALDPIFARKHFEIKSILFYEITDVKHNRITYKVISQVKSISGSGELVF